MTPAAIKALANNDLENFITAATPGGIEQQEAQGQKTFVAQQSLPIDGPRTELEALGFIFGEPIDDLFVSVKFPDGWTKKATDHSMHSDLLDEQGRKRGAIFYKAAFYDRRADMSLNVRYRAKSSYPNDRTTPNEFTVQDADGAVLYTAGTAAQDDYETRRAMQVLCDTWLDENFPDHRNPVAYW